VIAAALFDLDDTVYPQQDWLAGAWVSVAQRAAASGVPEAHFLSALRAVASLGTDKGRIIDRALAQVGCEHVDVAPLVAAFRMHTPGFLNCYPRVRVGLSQLAARMPVGIVTDGDPEVQRGKLRALDLRVDVVVLSDEFGRAHRKPDPLPFEQALEQLGVPAEDTVFVGDRPDKDIAGATAVGMRAIRVHTGEYGDAPDVVEPWQSVPTASEAIKLLLNESHKTSDSGTSV
jgi:putative hydrolase of the HAD superfamily